jgi:hypothetical protein
MDQLVIFVAFVITVALIAAFVIGRNLIRVFIAIEPAIVVRACV